MITYFLKKASESFNCLHFVHFILHKILYNREKLIKKEKGETMAVLTFNSDDYKVLPQFLKDYASYTSVIRGNNEKTICEYLMDLRTFFRFIVMRNSGSEYTLEEFEKISISHLTIDDVEKINPQKIIDFLGGGVVK